MSDLDVVPTDEGVLLPGGSGLVDWTAVQEAAGNRDPAGPLARRQVEILLRLHQLVLDLGQEAQAHFRAAARVLALPPGHAEHPGGGWIREPLRGGALDLGIGVQGQITDPDRTVPVPPSVSATRLVAVPASAVEEPPAVAPAAPPSVTVPR